MAVLAFRRGTRPAWYFAATRAFFLVAELRDFYPGEFSPMWAETPHPPINSDYMKFPDLNDGAGGRYIYGYQSRRPGTPIELGVLASNSSSTQPPTGWTKAGGDLNEGAGGDFIYFCIKPR